jgi:hypothetical protein
MSKALNKRVSRLESWANSFSNLNTKSEPKQNPSKQQPKQADKPFACGCGKEFATKRALLLHINAMNQNARNGKGDGKQHFWANSEIAQTVAPPRVFKCGAQNPKKKGYVCYLPAGHKGNHKYKKLV